MPGTQRNLLIVRPANGKFIVTPGHFHVDPGDTIHWRTLGTGATLTFPPNSSLFDCDTLDIPIGGHVEKVLSTNVKAGIYPYSVLCNATGEFAEGGSDPELIVCTGG